EVITAEQFGERYPEIYETIDDHRKLQEKNEIRAANPVDSVAVSVAHAVLTAHPGSVAPGVREEAEAAVARAIERALGNESTGSAWTENLLGEVHTKLFEELRAAGVDEAGAVAMARHTMAEALVHKHVPVNPNVDEAQQAEMRWAAARNPNKAQHDAL